MDDQELLNALQNDASSIVPNPRRASMLMALVPLVGLDPSSMFYQQTVYFFDSPAVAADLAKRQSGCGLVTEVAWRAVPVREEGLYVPVAGRSAKGGRLYPVALERDVAMEWGACLNLATWDGDRGIPSFAPGDAFIIGCSGCGGVWGKGGLAVEHEFTVAYCDSTAPDILISIDGGQPGCRIRRRKIVLVPARKEIWVGNLDASGVCAIDPADGRPVRGRRILSIIDADALPAKLL